MNSTKICHSVVDASIELTNGNNKSQCRQHLSLDSYINEYRTIVLKLPRQCGKSTYIKENVGLNDLVIFHSHQMMRYFGENLASNIVFNDTINLDSVIFTKQYRIIWCDELSLATLGSDGFKRLIHLLTRGGNGSELIVALTSR
jgi:hypothetical protein